MTGPNEPTRPIDPRRWPGPTSPDDPYAQHQGREGVAPGTPGPAQPAGHYDQPTLVDLAPFGPVEPPLSPPTAPPPDQPAPEWWPAPPEAWGPPVVAASVPGVDPWAGMPLRGPERFWVPAAHWLGLLTLWLGPLVVLLTVGERHPRVREHAKESLNFEVTVAVMLLGSSLLMFVGIGIVGLVLVPIAWLGLHLAAALRAARSEPFRYPLTLRLVR